MTDDEIHSLRTVGDITATGSPKIDGPHRFGDAELPRDTAISF